MLAGLAGCPSGPLNAPDPTPELTPELPLDTDGDGSPDSEDCAPQDPDIHPGATEQCDGLDTNCDGELLDIESDLDGDGFLWCIDDCDDEDPTMYPADGDGDGVSPCDGDCDDDDAAVSPDLSEADACDGLDNDCLFDPGEGDLDGDGFLACADDCDDDRAIVHPQHEEICDGRDNNCDGVRDDVPFTGSFPTGEVQLEDYTWATLYGEEEGDQAGSWGTAPGDLNGDGFGDLALSTLVNVVTAPDPSRSNRTYIVYGPICGDVGLALEPEGASNGVIIGQTGDMNHIGDVNGDGLDDLKVGAAIYFGPLDGELTPDDADILFGGLNPIGFDIPVVGDADVNGDGVNDLAVGDSGGPPTWNVDQQAWESGPGRVLVWFGPVTPGLLLPDTADAQIVGEAASPGWLNAFGRSMASLGDLDGDGTDDLLVGTPQWSNPGSGSYLHGRVDLFYGPVVGLMGLEDAGASVTTGVAEQQLGTSVARVGDMDGDGTVEWAVAAPAFVSQPIGQILVFSGALTGSLTASAATVSVSEAESFWIGGLAGADLSGDGRAELLYEGAWPSPDRGIFFSGDIVTSLLYQGTGASGVGTNSDVDGDGNVDLWLPYLTALPTAASSTAGGGVLLRLHTDVPQASGTR